MAKTQSQSIPPSGNLGLLAQGARGTWAWRRARDGANQPAEKAGNSLSSEKLSIEPKTIIIGWDAADWQVINPLLEQGYMPALQRLIQRGVSGNIATLQPVLSPLLWTSIATGRPAHEHGILSFVESDGQGKLQPVRAEGRKVKTFWNILEEAQLRCAVVNWWPSYPCEQSQGSQVSDRYASIPRKEKLPPGVIQAPDLEALLADLRLGPEELRPAHLQPFFPDVPQAELAEDPVVQKATEILARCATVHNAITLLLERDQWDVAAVYYEALDHFSHLAMKYHPPRLADIAEADFQRYREVVTAAYRFHDMMLERLLELVGPDCRVLLVSDHGFQSGPLRSAELPDLPAAPALEHRPYGVVVAAGPDLRPGTELYGASLLDILPTLLHWHGLPVGEDLAGRVWEEMWRQPRPLSRIPSWETTAARPAFLPNQEEEQEGRQRILAQLEALGYLQEGGSHAQAKVEEERRYNRALSLLHDQKIDRARSELEKLYQTDPSLRVNILFADVLLRQGQGVQFDQLLASWEESVRQHPLGLFLQGLRALQGGATGEALDYFEQVEAHGMPSPQLYLEMGRTLHTLGRLSEAQKYFRRILERDPDHAPALTGLGEVYWEQGMPAAALEQLDLSLRHHFYQPQAHYLLALCLDALERPQEARQALAMSLRQAPRHQKAQHLARQWQTGEERHPPQVWVVSGFPRSGTSMLMQILEAGGMVTCRDDYRPADQHNPRGYYEWEAVKELPNAPAAWAQAEGKAVKVVAPLLRYLPADFQYQVLWMDRPLLEVIHSQQEMKGASTRPEDFPFQLAVDYQQEEERIQRWLDQQPHISWLCLSYQDFLEQPQLTLERLALYLPASWDPTKALEAIRPDMSKHSLKPDR